MKRYIKSNYGHTHQSVENFEHLHITNIQKIIDFLENWYEAVYLTIGFGYRNPTTHNKSLLPEEAIEWVEEKANNYAYVELEGSNDGRLHLNAYTDNDMW